MKIVTFKPPGEPPASPASILRSTFKVGKFRCTMTLDCGAYTPGQSSSGFMRAEWEPDLPKNLNKKEMAEYRAGRDALHAIAANVIGGNIMIVEC